MDSTVSLKMLMALLPKLPLIARVAVLHVLRLSQPAQHLDLRSELVVAVLRSFLAPSKPRPISFTQRLSLRDAGVKGRMWVSTYASPPPPESDIKDALARALDGTSDAGVPKPVVRMPELAPVEAEWTGYRAAASPEDPQPDISEAAKFQQMMKECREPTTVLYLHGGAYYLCDPSTHRPTTKKLAKLTGGRCYSVRYRLAPQHPFPAALLDAFMSYLTLLYPPPDAYHEPVKPEHVVIAGDSAGGNLALALLQVILELRRQGAPVMWHGERREIPLPAGVACNSPWLDITHSSPAWEGEKPAPFDFLPKPHQETKAEIPACDIWPASPPRKYIYADDDLVAHPLSSVVMNRSWEGAPPIYMCAGWEMIAYEDKFLAQKLLADGVTVVFEEYEAMPHTFAMILPETPSARRCYEGWAAFIRSAVQDGAAIKSSAVAIRSKTLAEVPLRFDDLVDTTSEEIRDRILAMVASKPIPEATAKL